MSHPNFPNRRGFILPIQKSKAEFGVVTTKTLSLSTNRSALCRPSIPYILLKSVYSDAWFLMPRNFATSRLTVKNRAKVDALVDVHTDTPAALRRRIPHPPAKAALKVVGIFMARASAFACFVTVNGNAKATWHMKQAMVQTPALFHSKCLLQGSRRGRKSS